MLQSQCCAIGLLALLPIVLLGQEEQSTDTDSLSNVMEVQDEILSPIPSQPKPVLLMSAGPAKPAFLPTIDSLKTDWDVKADDIKWETAITLGELSKVAYTDAHNRKLTLRLMDFDEVETLDDGPMSGYVAMSDEVIVVVFRGTDMFSPKDWLANADAFWQKDMGRGRKVHKGFYNGYARFAKQIKRMLAGRSPKYIWVTGHSLGGAMATCCAYDWVINRMPLTGAVTFGQPRVGNPMFARFMDYQVGTRYIRFRNGEDIVPSVPPASSLLLPDYQHAGKQAWFKDGQWDLKRLMTTRLATSGAPDAGQTQNTDQEITAEELLDLQQLLRASQSAEDRDSVPDFLKNDQAPLRTGLRYGATENREGEAVPMTTKQYMTGRGYSAKFGDHSMIEYLRFLNESRK